MGSRLIRLKWITRSGVPSCGNPGDVLRSPGFNTVRSYCGCSISCLVFGSNVVWLELVRETIESAETFRIRIEFRNMSGRRFSIGLAVGVFTELLPWMARLLGGMSMVKV